jgi:hypothetical protein
VSGGYTFTDIAAGNVHSCGVLVNGSALCWGAMCCDGHAMPLVCLHPDLWWLIDQSAADAVLQGMGATARWAMQTTRSQQLHPPQ